MVHLLGQYVFYVDSFTCEEVKCQAEKKTLVRVLSFPASFPSLTMTLTLGRLTSTVCETCQFDKAPRRKVGDGLGARAQACMMGRKNLKSAPDQAGTASSASMSSSSSPSMPPVLEVWLPLHRNQTVHLQAQFLLVLLEEPGYMVLVQNAVARRRTPRSVQPFHPRRRNRCPPDGRVAT